MRKFASALVIASLVLAPVSSVYAQDLPTSTTEETSTLNAAPNTTAVTTADLNARGDYQEVSCSSDAIFGQNTCDQCFKGRSVKVGERITGISDDWKNPSSDMFVAVKDEQKTPNMVALDSVWTPTSADESKMWISGPQVNWTPGSSGKDEFILMAGQNVNFMQTDLGAGFTLTSSNKKNGDLIGLLRFPIVYYTMDANATRSTTPTTHYECVTYTLDAPATPTVTPSEPGKPTPPPATPKPADPTKVETGPAETLVLIVAAFFIAFGLMLSLRKRN